MIFGRQKREDTLLDMLRQDRLLVAEREAKVLALMERFVEATQSQQTFLTQYMKLFEAPRAPEVRVMDDAAEVVLERKRRAKTEHPTPEPLAAAPVSIPDFASLFEDLRAHAR